MTPQDVLNLAKEKGVKVLDLRFMDFPGMWQNTSYPISELTLECFEEGFGFDGSSIRGWQAINESDMLIIPQADTAFIDPFLKYPTLCLICNIADPITGADYTRDPRNIAKKAVEYLNETGIADTCFIGPEAEFFLFDDVRYNSNEHESYYHIDSCEGAWNTGRKEEGGNSGYKVRYKEGYFPVPPTDQLMDIRTEMMLHMLDAGIDVECHHH